MNKLLTTELRKKPDSTTNKRVTFKIPKIPFIKKSVSLQNKFPFVSVNRRLSPKFTMF